MNKFEMLRKTSIGIIICPAFLMFYDIYVFNREDEKEKKDEKSYKSVFEQFGISKPTLQMNPFTGKSIPTSVP